MGYIYCYLKVVRLSATYLQIEQLIINSYVDEQDQKHLLQDCEPITTDQFKSKKHIQCHEFFNIWSAYANKLNYKFMCPTYNGLARSIDF